MLKLSTKTKVNPKEVIKRAVQFFGPDGYGLKITGQSDAYASFVGGGGGVEVSAFTEGKGLSVDVTSREWDSQVREFIGKIR